MNAVDLDALVAARRHALKLRGLVSECACCGTTYAIADWVRLEFVGIQDAGDGEPLELRNCGGPCCRTTLAVQVSTSHAWLDTLRAISARRAETAERLLAGKESVTNALLNRAVVERAQQSQRFIPTGKVCANG